MDRMGSVRIVRVQQVALDLLRLCSLLISNFHMPLSTLLMIVAAFGGYEQVMEAYNVALKEEYRFGTYGDAMLITDR